MRESLPAPLKSPVEVEAGGQWYPGRLDRWKRDHRGWVGYVWWTAGVGLQHVEWIPADRLRACESRPALAPGKVRQDEADSLGGSALSAT